MSSKSRTAKSGRKWGDLNSTRRVRKHRNSHTGGVAKEANRLITRYAPMERFRNLDRFSQMMDDLFGHADGLQAPWAPVVDVKENEKELTFMVELPGLVEKDIDVEVLGDLLTISGKRELKAEERREDYVRIERSYGTFKRSFSLDVPVKPEDAVARFESGVLTVIVPKVKAIAPRKVTIRKA